MDSAVLYALYVATVVGAIALILIMPGAFSTAIRRIGGLLGAATLGGLWLWLGRFLPELGTDQAPFLYYYLFSGIAIIAAVRVISHTKPVYAALWFVMVILSSAGLLLILQAEFMAFALVIIYGGAILVTYMFVIMLAAQAGDASHAEDAPEYDRVAREPVLAVLVGFLMMALLLTAIHEPAPEVPAARGPSDMAIKVAMLTDRPEERAIQRLPPEQRELVRQTFGQRGMAEAFGPVIAQIADRELQTRELEEFQAAIGAWVEAQPWRDVKPRPSTQQLPLLVDRLLLETIDQQVSSIAGRALTEEDRRLLQQTLANQRVLGNVERVGFDLFNAHPLGLELAGVILLVALIGAVIMARQRVTAADEPEQPAIDEEVSA
ncbi:MAG: NADH-quinone oxidoreductase subunit J [Phycisphaeraceae bacterium]|nr:NADH-quinone oxidoreductase subunit J [Phycisphaeraceae bacterium]